MAERDGGDLLPPEDGTILRPRPGAGRRPAPPARPVSAPPEVSIERAAPAQTPRTSAHSGALEGAPAFVEFVASGRNPILQAAAPLLTFAARLQTSARQSDVAALRLQVAHGIRAFEDGLKASGIASEDALVARYVLCTFVDSAVLNTPWGAQSDWSGHSLLATFHRETGGGEKFFQILERLRADPARYIDLIELLYMCLALGFEGKYRLDERGHAKLAELQHEVYRQIRELRGLREQELSPRWHGVQDTRNPLLRFVPWWMAAAAGLVVLVIGFVWFQARLVSAVAPIKAALALPVAQVDYAAAAARPNRLKELLAAEEQAGRLTVEELGDKTVVTLVAANLFRSASARVNPEHYATLREVALALEQVPGRVLVVGHTDDQPLRSLRYADNFELSRERALAVAHILEPVLGASGRVEWTGVGASQPRYLPVDTSENRARNRRVEIVQQALGERP